MNISEVQRALSPNPFCLITTKKPDGSANIMALSWWNFASNKPPTLTVCVGKKGYTNQLIGETGEFVLNVADESLKDAAFKCGTCSGRERDKAGEFGIELEPAQSLSVLRVKAHRAALECRVTNSVDIGDHTLFVAEIVDAHVNAEAKALYSMGGYSSLGTV